jgi:hypothetical protein
MKHLRLSFLCSLALAVLGLTLVVYAGPCYKLTSVVTASQKGCYEVAIGNVGAHCPSVLILVTDNNYKTPCGFSIHELKFGIGTSGNEPKGRMNQGFVTRYCYQFEHCTASKIYYNYSLPFYSSMVYDCISGGRVNGYTTASSFEPTGAICPEE